MYRTGSEDVLRTLLKVRLIPPLRVRKTWTLRQRQSGSRFLRGRGSPFNRHTVRECKCSVLPHGLITGLFSGRQARTASSEGKN